MAAGPGLDRARRELRPRGDIRGSRELGHVQVDFRDDDLGSAQPDSGDFVERSSTERRPFLKSRSPNEPMPKARATLR